MKVNCTGQRPSSDLLAALAPSTVSPSGHIRVKPTLQLEDDSLPNIYACGDVTDTNTHNPNSRGAFRQATTAASNIVRVAMGGSPSQTFRPHWADGVIKLTLGLVSIEYTSKSSQGLTFVGEVGHSCQRRDSRVALPHEGERCGTHVSASVDAHGCEAIRGRLAIDKLYLDHRAS